MSAKTWDEMTPRERDALVAGAMNAPLPNPCDGFVYDMDGVLRCTACGYRGTWGMAAARHGAQSLHYTTDHNACRLVEDAVKQQQGFYTYTEKLIDLVCPDLWKHGLGDEDIFLHNEIGKLILATPDQRCRAACRAMGVEV